MTTLLFRGRSVQRAMGYEIWDMNKCYQSYILMTLGLEDEHASHRGRHFQQSASLVTRTVYFWLYFLWSSSWPLRIHPFTAFALSSCDQGVSGLQMLENADISIHTVFRTFSLALSSLPSGTQSPLWTAGRAAIRSSQFFTCVHWLASISSASRPLSQLKQATSAIVILLPAIQGPPSTLDLACSASCISRTETNRFVSVM